MRRFAALAMLAACGRIGYEANVDADAGLDGPGVVGTRMACGVANELIDVGDTGGAAATTFALDVAATTTGFVLAWQAGSTQTRTSALRFSADATDPYLDNLQSASVTAAKEGPIAIAALGDDVLLAIDDAANGGIKFAPLAESGYDRGSTTRIDGHRAYGHDYLVADPARGRFVVMAGTGAASQSFVLDRDGGLIAGPMPMFAVATEALAVRPLGATYAAITGNSSNCDVVVADASLVTMEPTRQGIPMTCHNASLIAAPGSSSVVAAWNCDNDRVWATGGSPASTLPMHHEVFGSSSEVSSDPRLTTTSAGVWYTFRVGADGLGVALLGADSQPVAGNAARVALTRPALRAHDAASHGEHAFLFWLEVNATTTSLWAMRMCPAT